MSKSIYLDLSDDDQLEKIAVALSSKVRRKMIRLSTEGSYSVMEIAQKLGLSMSTTSFHLKYLKDAGLVEIMPSPASRGNQKIVFQSLSNISLDLQLFYPHTTSTQTIEIPIGCYTSFSVEPTCGLVNSNGLIIGYDHPEAFYSPQRFDAQLLYFRKGYVEYCFPIRDPQKRSVSSVSISLEICSECPMSNNNWKSDITFWLNGVQLCTYHSQGDYGDRRGKNTPSFWPANGTQYGMLKTIRVDMTGTYIDETFISPKSIEDFKFISPVVELKIGVLDDAKYVGGVNLFGKGFGDYDQDIVVQVTYHD